MAPSVPSNSVSPVKRSALRAAAAAEAAAGGAEEGVDRNESLRRRMAGPSSAKAGLGLNQDEINRKIFEASKGSKFFENERAQDERITRNIDELLDKRDAALANLNAGTEAERNAKWAGVEARIETQAAELEAKRNVSRVIVHADMDMFYAAAELLRHPHLEGTAFAVGSGVLLTASYEARQFGCRSGMAEHIARALCPHLQVVKGEMKYYVDMSYKIMNALRPYDEKLMQMSLDEAYLDITDYCAANEVGVEEVVAQIREDVKNATGGLTVSCGIAPNTMLAKISSDKNKPNGQYRVQPDRQTIMAFMEDLSVRKVPGIGRVQERILEALDVKTCGDIWTHRVQLYLTLTALQFEGLLCAHLGLGGTKVEPADRSERKSVGREHTFKPTDNYEELLMHLRKSADQVAKDLEELDYRGLKVSLKCKGADYKSFTRDKTFPSHKYKADELYAITKKLFDDELYARRHRHHDAPFAARLIGVRVSSLMDLRKPNAIMAAFARAAEKNAKKEAEKKKAVVRSQYAESWAELGEVEDEESKMLRAAIEASLEEMQGGEQQDEGAAHDEAAQEPAEEEEEEVVWVRTSRSPSAPASPAAAAAASTSATSNNVPLLAPTDCLLGCGKRITYPRGMSEAAANAKLNSHLDVCTGSAAAEEEPDRKKQKLEVKAKSSKEKGKEKGKEKKVKGPMDGWLHKTKS